MEEVKASGLVGDWNAAQPVDGATVCRHDRVVRVNQTSTDARSMAAEIKAWAAADSGAAGAPPELELLVRACRVYNESDVGSSEQDTSPTVRTQIYGI